MSILIKQGSKAIEQKGADTLILGCTELSEIADKYNLQEKLGVPVIDPIKVAVKFAELLASLDLSHSKRAYPCPTKKPISYFETLNITKLLK